MGDVKRMTGEVFDGCVAAVGVEDGMLAFDAVVIEARRARASEAALAEAVRSALSHLGPDGYIGSIGKPRTDALRAALKKAAVAP